MALLILISFFLCCHYVGDTSSTKLNLCKFLHQVQASCCTRNSKQTWRQ